MWVNCTLPDNCTCACSYRAVRTPALHRTRLPCTRTVPRFRSRESFSLGLPTCPRFSQVAAIFYTHTLWATYAFVSGLCALGRSTADHIDERRQIDVFQLSKVATLATLCHTLLWVSSALIWLLLLWILGRTFFTLLLRCTYRLQYTCARGPLYTRYGSTLSSVENSNGNTVITQPATAPVAAYIDSIRPRPPRCAEDCGGWTLHACTL